MGRFRHSFAGAAVSGILACFASMASAGAAEPVGEFRVGNVWKGAASFYGAGNSFSNCHLTARFPEGWELTFLLDAKGVLGLEMFGPDDMDLPDDTAPVTLSVDGRILRTLAMKVDMDPLMFEELWLYADLGPAGDYLPALKKGGSIMVVLQGRTLEKPPQARSWSYKAALTNSAEAFQALEACVAKHAGTSKPAAAPATGGGGKAGSAASGATKGSTGAAKKAARYGAIAVGEDDGDLISGISSNHPSLEAAMTAAVETCEGDSFGTCTVRATMDRATPCGAVASGRDADDGPVYGWATGTIKTEAELGAMQACSADAFGCKIALSRCLSD